jgi:hypothetical protein
MVKVRRLLFGTGTPAFNGHVLHKRGHAREPRVEGFTHASTIVVPFSGVWSSGVRAMVKAWRG